MDEILILPGNEQELFDSYFDKIKYSALQERLTLLKGAIHNTLPVQECRRHKLTGDVMEMLREKEQLQRKLFQAVLHSFATRICEKQKEICEQQYWAAPCGKEAEYISTCRIPDLYHDPLLYTRIKEWWFDLNLEQIQEIACTFKDDFSSLNSDNETEDYIDRCWQTLPLEARERIYKHYNP